MELGAHHRQVPSRFWRANGDDLETDWNISHRSHLLIMGAFDKGHFRLKRPHAKPLSFTGHKAQGRWGRWGLSFPTTVLSSCGPS